MNYASKVLLIHLMLDIVEWTLGVGCGSANHQRRALVRPRVRDQYPLILRGTRMTRLVFGPL